MFDWVKSKFSHFRFELAFQQHEREQREKHLREAERRFGAVDLREEIRVLWKKIDAEATAETGPKLVSLEGKIFRTKVDLKKNESDLALFSRGYRTELSALYDELNNLKERLRILYEEKDDAFERKDRAKRSIDAWYAKSDRSFFGNKGKPLPKHSMFGQSFGDLECYKSDRDEASKEIIECAEEITDLKDRKKLVVEKIAEAKKARDMMFALKASGVTRKKLSDAIAICHEEARHLAASKAIVEDERRKLVEAARHQQGLASREATVENLDRQKKPFIQSFETRIAHLRRRVIYKRMTEKSQR
jgi:hypothetical protein